MAAYNMSTRKVLGILLLGISGLVYYTRRTVNAIKVTFESLKVQEVRIDNVVFQVSVLFNNPLFVDVTLDTFYGEIYMMGKHIAHVESPLEQVLVKHTSSSLAFYFKATIEQLGEALFDNIQTGDVKTLTIQFDGNLQVNGVLVPVKKTFTYDDLFKKKK